MMFIEEFQLQLREIFKPSGYVNVGVSCDNKSKNIKLYLIKKDTFPLLFVRDWISEFNIFPEKLKLVYVNEIKNSSEFRTEFSDLFINKVGKIKGMKAELFLDKDATPAFYKPVSYALRTPVNKELQRLQEENIIKPVNY